MPHRQGGKVTGSHTTVIDMAAEFVDMVVPLSAVAKVGLGFIQQMNDGKPGLRRVKLTKDPMTGTCIVAHVTQGKTVQILWVYAAEASARQELILALAKVVRRQGWALKFK